MNALAVAVLVARIMQLLVHACFVQTNAVVSKLLRADRQFSWFTVILLAKLSGIA